MVRIYDIFFDYTVLLSTDAFIREVSAGQDFQRPMSTAEYHYLLGGYLESREKALGLSRRSVLAAAHELEVPIYTSSPGDSSIGMNVAEQALAGSKLRFDVSADVNETASIVLEAKRTGGKSGVLIVGGGSPKNFMLQTEPQIQEVLGIDERGHDYFLQMTDARPDTGGLSGATPAEAVSWGKIDPDQLPGTVVVYGDTSIALPAAHRLRQGPAPGSSAQAAVRPAAGDDGPAGGGIPGGPRVPRRAGGGVALAHAPGRRRSRDGGAAVTPGYRWYALGLLALINLLNYIDRNVIFALFEPIKRELALTRHAARLARLGVHPGLLPRGASVRGHQRPPVAAGGHRRRASPSGARSPSSADWSRTSGSSSPAGRRSASARPPTVRPPPRSSPTTSLAERRAIAMGILASGIALGGVLGLLLGGHLEASYGWRVAFMTVGVPGFICAMLVARLQSRPGCRPS